MDIAGGTGQKKYANCFYDTVINFLCIKFTNDCVHLLHLLCCYASYAKNTVLPPVADAANVCIGADFCTGSSHKLRAGRAGSPCARPVSCPLSPKTRFLSITHLTQPKLTR